MPTETLRPNAAGDESALTPNSGANYACVNEAAVDEDSTYVYKTGTGYLRDLYNLPTSSGSETINFIKVYFRCRRTGGLFGVVKPALKSDSTVTDGTQVSLTTDYATYSEKWNTNPADSAAWEWGDIDELQIGVSLNAITEVRCTQIYVEVNYTLVTPVSNTGLRAMRQGESEEKERKIFDPEYYTGVY